MIAKLTDGVLHVLGNGELTQIHQDLGYIEVPEEDIELDVDGNRHKFYILDIDTTSATYGTYIADTVKIAEADITNMITAGEALVVTHIQSVIDKYNADNKVKFKNIDSTFKYTLDTTYTHYQFCIDINAFNTLTWETSRVIQADILAGTIAVPTEQEFIDLLPVYAGVVAPA